MSNFKTFGFGFHLSLSCSRSQNSLSYYQAFQSFKMKHQTRAVALLLGCFSSLPKVLSSSPTPHYRAQLFNKPVSQHERSKDRKVRSSKSSQKSVQQLHETQSPKKKMYFLLLFGAFSQVSRLHFVGYMKLQMMASKMAQQINVFA